MHEASIALAILAAVEDVFRRTEGARRVLAIRVRVGALSLLDIDALRFALEVASRGTPAEGARVEVGVELPRFRCRRCGHEWGMSEEEVRRLAEDQGLAALMHLYPEIAVSRLRCPRCGSADVEVVKGKEVVLEAVELDVEGGGARGG